MAAVKRSRLRPQPTFGGGFRRASSRAGMQLRITRRPARAAICLQRSRVYRWRRNRHSSFWPNKLGVSGIGGNLSRRRARRLPAPSRIFAGRLPTSAKGWPYNHSSGQHDFSCNRSSWTRTLDRSRGQPPNIAASAASRASPISNYRCCRGRSYRQERHRPLQQ